jgi:hypothetical protein
LLSSDVRVTLKSMRTITSNENALKQYCSVDGKQVLSIVASSQFFRFVEEQLSHQPATPSVGAYDYWEETHRSGLYETVDMAERAAMAVSLWLAGDVD